jgi:acyl-CoA dehydrogenase
LAEDLSMVILTTLLGVAVLLALGHLGAPLWAWTSAVALWLVVASAPWWAWLLLVPPAVLFHVPELRRRWVSRPIFDLLERLGVLPQISETEKVAIEAGTVWVDGELFSGRPSWKRLMSERYAGLTQDEQSFLDGPVEQLCKLVDDWQVWQQKELPPVVWDTLKKQGFLGMIIPREHGGLGFSASMNSAVVMKLASRSLSLGITVMVPNSLGPAELLIHYGTEAQKQRWLPRLASGEEIPCFALTEPGAGSDAGSMQASGVVFRGPDGEPWIRLDWSKRYITLASIATVLGLAFKLSDPENLLGKGTSLGITCALIPATTKGVVLGRRHDPLGVPFHNCPTEGHGVEVPLDAVIGGLAGAGKGWRMLMECLAAGRGISLPATATGGAKIVARVTSAYATLRKQFGLSIGKFEGIEEPLARIGAFTYLLEAARRYTCGGLDDGAKPPVVTAIAKYESTELFRKIINDGMDILGGAAISRGPRNMLAHAYTGAPISITVEGANILTRTLMIFGQGAIRCHPFAFKEIDAIATKDLVAFDKAFFGHVGHVVRNSIRSLLLSLSRGHLAWTGGRGPARRAMQRMSWASARFALLADLVMAALGGDLKRKEKLTGRFADVFGWLYLGTATVRRFVAEGMRKEDRPFFEYAIEHALSEIQRAFEGILRNLDVPVLGLWMKGPWSWLVRLNPLAHAPSDRLGSRVARAMQQPGNPRQNLTAGIHVPKDPLEALGRLEAAFAKVCAADEVATKIKDAVRTKKLPKDKLETLVPQAVSAGVITAAEAQTLVAAEAARTDAIQVDSFTQQEYLGSMSSWAGEEPALDACAVTQ